jgi:hypothetical protein
MDPYNLSVYCTRLHDKRTEYMRNLAATSKAMNITFYESTEIFLTSYELSASQGGLILHLQKQNNKTADVTKIPARSLTDRDQTAITAFKQHHYLNTISVHKDTCLAMAHSIAMWNWKWLFVKSSHCGNHIYIFIY